MTLPETFKRCELDIRRLRASQPNFNELWADYLEITSSIDRKSLSGPCLKEMRRLKESLEQDIWDVLKPIKTSE
jgi:hypothetical protein